MNGTKGISDIERTRVGELRPTQMLYTYGVGAIVELPNTSVMVMGLDDWDPLRAREITEERLLGAIQAALGGQVSRLLAPPMPPQADGFLSAKDENSKIGVPVAPFPRWLRCPACGTLAPLKSGLFKFRHDTYRMDRARFVHDNCQRADKPVAVPARFLVACEEGHLDDFPWVDFVHRGSPCAQPLLKMREYGVSGEAADIEILCTACSGETKTRRRMAEAFGGDASGVLPPCRGRRPHLRDYTEEGCPLSVRTIGLGASNTWFPVTKNALSIPVDATDLVKKVSDLWNIFKDVDSTSALKFARKQLPELHTFATYTDDELWEAIEKRRQGTDDGDDPTDLKAPEWRVLTDPNHAPESKDFRLQEVPVPEALSEWFDKVVLASRLREVTALLGFTRLESSNEFGAETDMGTKQVSLSRQPPAFVPSGEVRGEGIFIMFNEARLNAWTKENDKLKSEFFEAHCAWRKRRGIEPNGESFPGMRFILIHTFSHALMRQLSLECGYASASIRERIYAREAEENGGPMAGVLLYTAAPDSEGTLGGLVQLGQPEHLKRHVLQALEQIKLCTSDPLCAEHHPDPEGATLHAAACHACLFAPETSCERGNQYLDRSVLIETVDQRVRPFFET